MAHIHELIDFTVEVFIVHNGKVLLRLHDKYNIWLSVGGHIELDEDPNQAAVREVKEEVGLDIELFSQANVNLIETAKFKELIAPRFMNIHKINEVHKHISLVYFAKALNAGVKVDDATDKSTNWKWMTSDEVKSDTEITEDVRKYALTALKEII